MSTNPNKIITLQELINAQVDAYKLELIMNEAPWVEIQTRLGRKCYSITTINTIIEQFQLDTQTALSDLQNAIAQIVEGGVPDLAVSTWSGRTQREKNKDFISGDDVLEYGFSKFESEYSGVFVDLNGKVFDVASLPTNNSYFNGYFNVEGVLKLANNFYDRGVIQLLKRQLERLDPVGVLSPADLDYQYTYIQSAIIRGDYLYTLQDNRVDSDSQSSTLISRFEITADSITYKDSMTKSLDIGHQSLAMDKDGYLWSRGVNASTGAVRFAYNQGAAPVVQNYVISDRIIDVAISSDGLWLIGRGGYENDEGSIQTFTIYELDKLILGGPGNYIGQHSYYFEVEHSSHSVQSSQAVFSDGKYIYFLRGYTTNSNPSFIYVYDFFGNLIDFVEYNAGRAGILTNGTVYEPQWIDLQITNGIPKLFAGISTGTNKGATSKSYVFDLTKEPIYKQTTEVEKFIGSSIGIGTKKKLNIDEYTNLALNIKAPSRDMSSVGMYCHSDLITSSSVVVFCRALADDETTIAPATLGTNIARIVGKSAVSSGGFSTSAGIYMQIDAVPSESFAPANVTIYTYDVVSNTNTARLKVNSNGSVDFTPPSTTEYAAKFSRQLTGDLLQFNIQGDRVGSIYSTSATFYIASRNGKNLAFGFSSTESGSVSARLVLNGDGGAFRPAVTNSLNLGEAAFAFKDEYFQNAPIVTSDERQKQQFRSLCELEKAAALEIKSSICLFKFNDSVDLKGDGARWHVGVKAQQVVSIMQTHGLDPFDYAFVCFDEWCEQDEIIDESGEVTQEYRSAGSRYAIRYNELAMFILAAI